MKRTSKAWVNFIFFVVTLAVNALGALGWINGLSQKEISDRYITLITPSSATFGIWSIIYSLLLLSIIIMIIKHDDYYYLRALDQISGLFRWSCLLNIAWIVTFSYVLVELSVLFILAFVLIMTRINQKLFVVHEAKRWLLPLTFGLYAGWLFIATVVNSAAALVKVGWSGVGLSAETWAIIMLVLSVVLVIGVNIKIRHAVFPLPIAWAYYGIYQYLQSSEGFKGAYPMVETVALAGAAVLVLVALFQFMRNRYSLLPASKISR